MNFTVFRIIAFAILIQFSFVSLRLISSLDALANNANSLHVGFIISAQALAPMFFAMACGRWIDRVGTYKPIYVGALIVLTAAALPCIFVTSSYGLWPLYATCLLSGLGYMFVMIVSQQLVGYVTRPETRTIAFSWLALGYSTSGLVSPLVAGLLIDNISHRAAFCVAFCFSLAGFLVFLIFKKTLPEFGVRPKKDSKKQGSFALFKIPQVRRVILISAIVSMAWDLQHFMFPVYGHSIGLSASEIGLLVSAFFSATFLVRLVIPVLTRHITEWQFLTLVMVIATIGYSIFPLFHSLLPLIIVAFILGLGLGCAQPNVMSLVHRESPPGHVGEALGMRTMMINLSHTTLPSLFGLLTAAIGVSAIFYSMSGIFVISALACYKTDKK